MGNETVHTIPPGTVEVSATDLRTGLRDWLERVAFGQDEIVVTRAGRPVAAMISMDAYLALRKMLGAFEDHLDFQAVKEARNAGDYVPFNEVLKSLPDGS